MATIKDVARLAGVSPTTVSRVLNNRSASRETTERVLEAVDALDYRVNLSARGLVRQHTNTVGVIVADISNPPISRMFHGIDAQLRGDGLTVMLGNSESDPEKELDLVQMFAVQKTSGVIYTGPGISDRLCDALNEFPGAVVVAAQQHNRLERPVVRFDNVTASREVTALLVAQGHERIGFLGGPTTDPAAGSARLEGYRQGMEEGNLELRDELIEHAPFSIAAGYAAMERMIGRVDELPSAVFAAADLIAMGAMQCLHERGLRVPGDIAVFGFDNLPVGAHLVPALASVELDFRELGEVAADLLYRIISRGGSQVREIVLRHRLITRESCAPPRRVVSRP